MNLRYPLPWCVALPLLVACATPGGDRVLIAPYQVHAVTVNGEEPRASRLRRELRSYFRRKAFVLKERQVVARDHREENLTGPFDTRTVIIKDTRSHRGGHHFEVTEPTPRHRLHFKVRLLKPSPEGAARVHITMWRLDQQRWRALARPGKFEIPATGNHSGGTLIAPVSEDLVPRLADILATLSFK